MFSKFALSSILLLAALPAAAQPPAAAPPAPPAAPSTAPPELSPELKAAIQRTATAFSQCISGGIQNAPASATPEAAAAAVMSGCATQRAELTQSVEAAFAIMPEAQRTEAHTEFETQMGQAETQIATAIRQQRAAAAAPAIPSAPATPPH
jgi:hypothetical protein